MLKMLYIMLQGLAGRTNFLPTIVLFAVDEVAKTWQIMHF